MNTRGKGFVLKVEGSGEFCVRKEDLFMFEQCFYYRCYWGECLRLV